MLADEKPLGLQSRGGGEGSSPQKLPMGKPLSCLLRSLRPCGRRSGVTLQCLTEEGVLVSLLPRALGRAGDRPSLPCLLPPRSGEPGSGQPGAPGSRSASRGWGEKGRAEGLPGARGDSGRRVPSARAPRPRDLPCLPPARITGQPETPLGKGGIGVPGKGPDFLSSRPLRSPILLGRRDRRSRLLLPARPSARTTGPPALGRMQPGGACSWAVLPGRAPGAPPALCSCGVAGGRPARGPPRKDGRCSKHMGRRGWCPPRQPRLCARGRVRKVAVHRQPRSGRDWTLGGAGLGALGS